MEQLGVAFIQKLNGVEIAILLLAVIGFALYIVTHIRRDKQGKLYIYNKTYQLQKESKYKVEEMLAQHIENDGVALRELRDSMHTLREEMQKADLSLAMESLKQSVFMENMPTREKLYAGLKYIQAGGNSETRKEMLNLIFSNKEIYEGICTGRPDLRLNIRSSDANDEESAKRQI